MCQVENIEEYNNRNYPIVELPEPEFNNRIDKLHWKLAKIAANKNWIPDAIADKLGFVCHDCGGYRNLRILPGEKHCICSDTIEGAKEWWKERNDIV